MADGQKKEACLELKGIGGALRLLSGVWIQLLNWGLVLFRSMHFQRRTGLVLKKRSMAYGNF